MMIPVVFLSVAAVYCLFIVVLFRAWEKRNVLPPPIATLSFSILVPFRNEAEQLAKTIQALAGLNYPPNAFEIIFIDDHSTDQSNVILIQNSTFLKARCSNLLVLSNEGVGKKTALHTGVKAANFERIITLDADTITHPELLNAYNTHFQQECVQFVAGAVVTCGPSNFLNDFQQLDFLSLVGSGGSLIRLGWPVMCNGANLAFTKSGYLAIGGYQSHTGIASGDDVFLLHAFTKKFTPASICFMATPPVIAEAPKSWSAFFNQRLRWAGKAVHYTSTPAILTSVLIFSMAIVLVVSPIVLFLGFINVATFLVLWLLKCIPDYYYLKTIATTFKLETKNYWLSAVLYPFYIVFTAIASWLIKVNWKDRKA